MLYRLIIIGFCLYAASVQARREKSKEIEFPKDAFAKLDTFEGLNLEDADKLYRKQDYKGAFSAYKAYSDEFKKGKALPYALLRMGRCLHLLNKRNAAIRAYQEVVDYFPNDVAFAAGALYYMGLAHLQNGDTKKCLAVWARMVKDKAYVTQPNSGAALEYLAKAMDKAEKFEDAATYRWRTAVSFKKSNPEAAREAGEAVLYHYAIRKPNHEKLYEFCKEIAGFHNHHKPSTADKDTTYWNYVFQQVIRHRYAQNQADMKKKAAAYWVAKIGSQFMDNDELRCQVILMQFFNDGDSKAWETRMHEQFNRSAATVARLRSWVERFGHNPKAQGAFIMKHIKVLEKAPVADLQHIISRMRDQAEAVKVFNAALLPRIGSLKTAEKISVLQFLMSRKMYTSAKQAIFKIDVKNLKPDQLVTVGMIAGDLSGEEEALRYFNRISDKTAATKARYDFYLKKSNYNTRNFNADMGEKALIEIKSLEKVPEYAQQVLWPKAVILDRLKQYEPAIKAYKAANKQPQSTWAVADCLIKLQQYDKAILTVRGLESIGGNVAAQACFKISEIYKLTKNKTKEIEQLRLVLRRYPESRESSAAHLRLEALGAKITGGKAKANE